jgi:hypothetical protein
MANVKRQAGEHGELVARDHYVNVLEVVLLRVMMRTIGKLQERGVNGGISEYLPEPM